MQFPQFCHGYTASVLRLHVPTRKVTHIADMPFIATKHSTNRHRHVYIPSPKTDPCHSCNQHLPCCHNKSNLLACTAGCQDDSGTVPQKCHYHHQCMESETDKPLHKAPPGPPVRQSTLVCLPLCLMSSLLVNCDHHIVTFSLMMECVITSLCDVTTWLLTLDCSASEVWAGSTIGSVNF